MLSLVEAFLGFFIRLLESNLTARRMFEAEISADAEKAARPQRLSAGNSYDLRMALALQFVRAWNVRRIERDIKNRKVFRWAQNDDSTHWPNASGALGGIEDADRGERIKDCAGLGRSEPRRCRCHSLPGDLSKRRRMSPSLSFLHQRLDRQGARSRKINPEEN